MSERRKSGLSISFRIDEGVVEHNNREFIAKNVDRARIPDNVSITGSCDSKAVTQVDT